MTSNLMKILLSCFLAVSFSLSLSSCTKDVPPELLSNKQKTTDKTEKKRNAR